MITMYLLVVLGLANGQRFDSLRECQLASLKHPVSYCKEIEVEYED